MLKFQKNCLTMHHIYSTYTAHLQHMFYKCAVAAHVLLCTIDAYTYTVAAHLLHITAHVLYCSANVLLQHMFFYVPLCTIAAHIWLQHMYWNIYAENVVLQHLCNNVLLQNMFWYMEIWKKKVSADGVRFGGWL